MKRRCDLEQRRSIFLFIIKYFINFVKICETNATKHGIIDVALRCNHVPALAAGQGGMFL